jgi:hypothetical protein
MSEQEQLASGLVIIARNTTGQIITRLTCTRSRELISAMKSARSVLKRHVSVLCEWKCIDKRLPPQTILVSR